MISRARSSALVCLAVLFATTAASPARSEEPTPLELLQSSKRVLFLGDSITAAGQYIVNLEAWMLTRDWKNRPHIIDAGLPSETVSGLSEEGHAGGKFPRPDLAERLDRVLKATKPDLVFACYGMNCGIYEPFDQGRFEKYQQGIANLRNKVAAAGARIIHITPPYFDAKRMPKPAFYNGVLDRYSEWLLGQRKQGWTVIDLHTPMTKAVETARETNPEFTFQPDGVHPNDAGHWFIAQQLIQALGDASVSRDATPADMLKRNGLPESVLPLVRQRTLLLRDAYVGAAGHLRPGVAKGLPVEEAEAKAQELAAQIQQRIQGK